MALSLVTDNSHSENHTKRRVLLAPDGCTKYYEIPELDLEDFADWCLNAGRPERDPFVDVALAGRNHAPKAA